MVETDANGNAITAFNIMKDACPATGVNFLKRTSNSDKEFKDYAMKAFKYPEYDRGEYNLYCISYTVYCISITV